MNNTTMSSASSINDSLNVAAIAVYSFACILGCIGNGIVIWITGFKMKKTANTVWFLNLAIADFIFTTFLPLTIFYTANSYNWIFGKFMCQFNSLILCLTMFASVFLLTAISVDRCVAVVAAVWSQTYRSPRTASIACLIVWLLAIVLGTPYAAYRDLRVTPIKTVCATNYSSDEHLRMYRQSALTITRFLCGFLIPLIIIILCYSAIIWRYNNLQRRRCFKPFRIIVAVIVAFFICWAPFHIIQLLQLKNIKPTDTLYKVVRIGNPIVTSIAFLNSCLNPVLYVCMCQDFRHKFKKSVLLVMESAFTEEGLISQLSQRRPTVQIDSLLSLQKKNSIS